MRQPIPFGKYLLLERISVGGMAEVFKAKSFGVEGFEKIIAIKRILPSMAEDAEFIQMFIDEAKIAGQLSHANVCQIFELGKISESHFIAMEFVWGKDLLQIANRFRKLRQTMPIPMACFVAAKVCEGLDYAHRKKDATGRPLNIVHRDVSPQNILVSYEGEVKLIDFGIAKAATRSSKTQAGVLKGKFGYMSPEQVRGLPIDRRSDLFALGTILYELMTGERLFLGESDFSTLEKVRNADFAPPSTVNKLIPPQLERIVMKALARDVEDRYQWANELQEDLMQFMMGLQPVYTAKQLSQWMKEAFAAEMSRERQLLEQYKKVGRDGVIAGKPAAEASVSIDEGLGAPPPPEEGAEATMIGGPSFEDVEDQTAAARRGGRGSAGFGDEAPTEIFGEVNVREPTPLMSEPTAILAGGSSGVPGVAAPPPPGRPPPPPAAALGGAPEPAKVLVGLAATLPASASPPPGVPAVGSLPPAGPPFGPPGVPAIGSAPGNGFGETAAVPKIPMAAPPPSRRAALLRDVGLGLGVAVLVVALLLGGRWLIFGDKKPAVADVTPTGTIVVATIDEGPGEVWVNGEPKGALTGAEPLTLENLAGGEYTITVKRPGANDCVQKVVLDVRKPALVTCRFQAVAEPGKLVLQIVTEGVTIYVDKQEISAEAAREPILLTPDVPHEILIKREGYVQQSLQVTLRSGELLERRVELQPAGPTGVVAREDRPPRPAVEPRPPAAERSSAPAVRTDAQKPDAQKPDAQKPDAQKPDAQKPDAQKPDAQKPEEKKPVEKRPEEKRPEEKRPEERKPVDRVADARPPTDERKPVEKKPVEKKPEERRPDGAPTDGGKPAGGDEEVGWLIANTTPWARVWIDGVDTGKMTPIAPRAKIPLKPGKHTVTFVVGDKKFSYPINIEAGRDHRLIKQLPVDEDE